MASDLDPRRLSSNEDTAWGIRALGANAGITRAVWKRPYVFSG